MNFFRRLYDWVLHWSETKYGLPALFILSLSESSFFPIPPDVLLIALALGMQSKALYFAFICSIASILGGMLGYAIGYFFYNEIPNSSIVIGAILIVLGGLYIAYRENKIENTLKVR